MTSSPVAESAPQFKRLVRAHKWGAALKVAATKFGPKISESLLFARIGETLVEADMVAVAETCFEEGLTRWPDDIWLLYHYANLATFYRTSEVAFPRWQDLISRHPGSPLGICGMAVLRQVRGDDPGAEALFADATGLFPDYVWAADGYANSAARREDWPTALVRWIDVIQRFPGHQRAYEQTVRALVELQDFEAARVAVCRGIEAFPASPTLLAQSEVIMTRLAGG